MPDIILLSALSGVGLSLRQVFPEAFIAMYFAPNPLRMKQDEVKWRALMQIEHVQLCESDLYFVSSEMQKNSFPACLRKSIWMGGPFVDLAFYSPADSRSENLITFYVAGDNSAISIFSLAKKLVSSSCRVCLIMTDEAKQTALSIEQRLEKSGIFFFDMRSAEIWRDILRESKLVVFTDPFDNVETRLLEALGCETAIMAPEIFTQLLPFPAQKMIIPLPAAPDQRLAAILNTLREYGEHKDARAQYRQMAVKHCGIKTALPAHAALLLRKYKESEKR